MTPDRIFFVPTGLSFVLEAQALVGEILGFAWPLCQTTASNAIPGGELFFSAVFSQTCTTLLTITTKTPRSWR